jgi:hypothetical protein
VQSQNIRPQMSVNLDLNSFFNKLGDARHQVRLRLAPGERDDDDDLAGNGILAVAQTPTVLSRRSSVRAAAPTAPLLELLRRRHHLAGRSTIDLGLRYDQQGGTALRASPTANPRSRRWCPASNFAGYDAPFTWKNLSPARRLHLRARRGAQDRGAGELQPVCRPARFRQRRLHEPELVGGRRGYRWLDPNGDHLARLTKCS